METQEKIVDVNVDGTFVVKTDAGELCRLCANTDNQFIPIFQGEGLEHNLSLKIETHLPIIKVTEADKLPLQICYQCASTLISWHNLYESCRVADKRLREIIAVDEKLYQEDDSCGDFADDFRDDYDDDTPVNLPTETPSTSNLESNTFKDNPTEIPTLSETKSLINETELEESDERYLRWSDCDSGDDYNRSDHINDYDYEYYYNDRDDRLTKVAQRSTSKKRPKQQQQRRRSAKIPRTRERPALTSKIIDDDGLTGSSNDLCDCVLSRTRCQKCSELNRFKCYYCPMVFLKVDERNRHLRASHRKELLRNSFELFYRVGQKIEEDEGEVVDEIITDTIDQLPQNSEYECDNCAVQFGDKVTLIEHLNDHEKHEKQIVVNDDDFDDREISDASDEHDEDEETMEARRQYLSIAVARRCSRKSPKTLACSKKSNISSENAASDSAAYECANCAEIFSTKGEIRKHLSSVHGFKTPKLSYGLRSSTAKKEESKIIQELAKQSFRQFGTYTVPERGEPSSQTSAGYYICAVCGQIFLKRHSFTRHVNQHSSSRLNCDKCKKSFTTKGALLSHQNLKHKDLPKNVFILNGRKYLKCEQCSFTCRNERNKMEEHMRVHTGEKPFTCELCGKQFRTKALLRVHSRYVHEGIKEHACDICGRCFSNKRYMEEHRRIHTGEKPLICDLCGKTFRQNSSLTKHVENHLGIKRHGCHLCGKRYSNSHHLSIHIKRHMGEANFMCDQCGKGFVDQYQLKNHKVVHSEERPFVCMLCGTGFKLLKHLKQHGRTHKTC